jgi:hypothetical protein
MLVLLLNVVYRGGKGFGTELDKAMDSGLSRVWRRRKRRAGRPSVCVGWILRAALWRKFGRKAVKISGVEF